MHESLQRISRVAQTAERSSRLSVPIESNAVEVRTPRLSDIAAIFNLIQLGSANGVFTKLYLKPRYQAGLGLQLFSCLYFGRIRLPDGTRHKVKMLSAYRDSKLAGFVILRDIPSSPGCREIYMIAVAPEFQRKGVGTALLASCIEGSAAGSILEATCLPKAQAMRRLLQNAGFVSVTPLDETAPQGTQWRFTSVPAQASRSSDSR